MDSDNGIHVPTPDQKTLLEAATLLSRGVSSMALSETVDRPLRRHMSTAARRLHESLSGLGNLEQAGQAIELAGEVDALLAGFDVLSGHASSAKSWRVQKRMGLRARILIMRASALSFDLVCSLSRLPKS